jgi:zinc D-Ala-D-Ala carboxypeptidase
MIMRVILCVLILQSLFVTLVAQPVDKKYLLGQFDPTTDTRFSKLKDEHTGGSARGSVLRSEAYEAFQKMAEVARKEGITLTIVSATRNFESQKRIWENKWNGKTKVEGKDLTTVKDKAERAKIILRFSSMPGSSRHHWGTDMDLNNLENSYFESGEGLKIYQWLVTHAHEFGFCQPYTSKADGVRTGYEEEKWHWSYLPLSKPLLESYIKTIRYKDIAGFKGSETAPSIKIIENYAQGIGCK